MWSRRCTRVRRGAAVRGRVDVLEIGFELATARALCALADVLLKTAKEDVQAVAGDEDGYHSDSPTGAW